ncbi:MAG TPA: thioredoxin-disulfide reductase [Firmicutes bacterium]|jgi:thioredoxin reductase (NADPH)|nr:thioredoxin-disulfide reductase [Bacillota bacterium]
MYDVIIIGSGPAGLTAAIYAARANLDVLVTEGDVPGGQLTQTTVIENFPGFPMGIDGNELMEGMHKQAERFGAQFVLGTVTAVEFQNRPFKIHIDDTIYSAKAVIVATGSSPKALGVKNEKLLQGRGVSTCATCDGHFFRNRAVAVVGGGDSALEEALYLARLADHVTVIHRRDEFRASKVMQERVLNNPKISIKWHNVVDDILDPAQNRVTGLRLKHTLTGEMTTLPVDGVFIAIGHTPNTQLFEGQLELVDGYIKVYDNSRTSVTGVFVAGDVQDGRYRQAITAAGSGCKAAMDCERWLEETAKA